MALSCCSRPGTFTKAQGLIAAVKAAVSHASKTGEVLASSDEVATRLKVCEVCPNKSGARCTLCGCFLTLKAGLLASTCPAGKWQALRT